jgi:plastocyanin
MPDWVQARFGLLVAALMAIGLLGAGCGGQSSQSASSNATAADTAVVAAVSYTGVQHRHYRYGPIRIRPGQNPIVFRPETQKPAVPGYITRFHPDLIYTNGKKPGVDVLHLHHGVWVMRDAATFATGEEKTITQFPRGFGYHYDPADRWILNYMLHNLTTAKAQVYLTWDIDFVPDSAPGAAGIQPVEPLWVDAGRGNYPVFDAQRGWGKDGRYTFPDDARGAERRKIGPAQHITMPQDVTLVAAGGHVHPGGLHVDLKTTRGNRTKTIFRSEAKYYEPAGAVSWDASMTFTKPDWRVAVRKGDTLSVSATYDTSRASWYEVMGIIDPLWVTTKKIAGARDPFTQPVDWHGVVTHGHLPENNNHGGTGDAPLPDARTLAAGPPRRSVDVKRFGFQLGDLTSGGTSARPPTVKQGGTLTFRNLDSPKGQDPALAVYHTITACQSPCNKSTGIAYPLADGKATFDSGELGYGPRQATAAANRITWKTPRTLSPGTYSYFCRIHPFMRGAFRVTAR